MCLQIVIPTTCRLCIKLILLIRYNLSQVYVSIEDNCVETITFQFCDTRLQYVQEIFPKLTSLK